MKAFYQRAYFLDRETNDQSPDWMDDYPAPCESTRRYSVHNRWLVDRQQKFQLGLIKDHKKGSGTRLLEIGSGRGDFLQKATKAGYECYGVEPSESAVHESQGLGLKVYQGTLEEFPAELEHQEWDVLFMSHVFEHLYDPLAAVKRIKALLSDGGIAVIEVPNQFESWLHRIGFALNRLLNRERSSTIYSIHHLNFFSIRHLEALFSTEGFQVHSYSWSPKRFDSLAGLARACVETFAELTCKQGSNIQIVAVRKKES